MPRSSGTFTLVAGNPVVSGTVISSTVQNNTLNDIGNEITNSIPRDGSAPPTANVPLGNFKITGLGAATLATDVPQFQQVQSGNAIYLTSVTGTNAITASLIAPSLATYAAGNVFNFTATGTNTGATTININALGIKTINKDGAALNAGYLVAGRTYSLIYDGTIFNLFGANSDIYSGYKNKIINGAMQIDQRNNGASQSITAAGALAYTVDRWYGYCAGANVTGQRVAGTSPSQFNYQYTGVAAVTKIAHAQRIEAANSQDLAGNIATLSVFLSNSLLTVVTWTAFYANTIDTFGTLASLTRTTIATGTFTVSSTLARFNTQIAIPSAATTGIEIEFSVGAQISGAWTIGRTQLEIGTVATPFEFRSIGQEIILCERYYKTLRSGIGLAASTTVGQLLFSWRRMRATPIINSGIIKVVDGNSSFTQSGAALTVSFSDDESGVIQFSNFTGLTALRVLMQTQDSGFVTVSAEL